MMIPNNPHMPDKYCPACGAIWVPCGLLGDCPTCQCSCISVGTIRHDPVSREQLTVRPRITTMARKYMNCPFPKDDADL